MIKRSESKVPSKTRRPRTNRVKHKRRLIVEGLEQRQLLAGDVTIASPDINLPQQTPRNIGTVQAFVLTEGENGNQIGQNDFFTNAELLPLGNGPGQQDTIDLTGQLSLINQPGFIRTDVDTYAFDLKQGDILDIAILGVATSMNVLYDDGSLWFGTDSNQGTPAPGSPLMNVGNAVAAQVVPEDGRYYLSIAPGGGNGTYTLGLRTYRPLAEGLPVGTRQILFVDFDGAIYPGSIFGNGTIIPGVVRVPSLKQSLPLFGIQEDNQAALDKIITDTMAEVHEQFNSIVTYGNNGDFDSTGIAGQYGITILNSRDHPDPGGHPLVTRVVVGGTQTDVGQATIGLSSTLDVGNFKMDDIVFGVLDSVVAGITGAVAIDPSVGIADAISAFLALLVTHEAGHSFGMRHTTAANFLGTIMDEGGNFAQAIGAGPDLIFGSADDVEVEFRNDRYSLAEGLFGTARTPDALANTLVVGKAGGTVTGRAFRDANEDGSGAGDAGLGGVTIFADVNGNGIQDVTEPSTVTTANGTYNLKVPTGTFNVIAVLPQGAGNTTSLSRQVTATFGGTVSGVSFGFTQVSANITGFKWADLDGDGVQDAGEPGIEGVFVYLDLNGDDRPGLGEPKDLTAADGSYQLTFPGPGTYTIREVVEAGFIQSFPVGGEHTVVFDGTPLTTNFNFGNQPARDYGDAPASFGTPNHGLLPGLSIGQNVDAEPNAQPTAAANGDDIAGPTGTGGGVIDDEDGVVFVSPLAPGASGTVSVELTNNSTSPAYLRGWIDFNADGVFTANERLQTIPGTPLATGNYSFDVNVPAGAIVGETYARFRYSQSQGLGPGGTADTGEVEDHLVTILADANIANDDSFSVTRNSFANVLDVLANDFQPPNSTLQIVGNPVGDQGGSINVSGDAQSILYSPLNGFLGVERFTYTVGVFDASGNQVDEAQANVQVAVTFQSDMPIAIDDTFALPEGSVNRALNVLENDIASTAGGLTIVQVTPGDQGGTISIIGGGQSLRYTPLPGVNGTEQFEYIVQDPDGNTDRAQVTINLLPGSLVDNIVNFTISLRDVMNNTPITDIQVGDAFDLTVSVEDVRPGAFVDPRGVASAFLDLLYNDELVAIDDSTNVRFGPLFAGAGSLQNFDSDVPGLIDESGAIQPVGNQQEHPLGQSIELFTVRLEALAPGVAVFQADPADEPISETIVLDSDAAATVNQLGLGQASLTIRDALGSFASAVDDSFPMTLDGQGNQLTAVDSLGAPIVSTGNTTNILDVLENDNFGSTGVLNEFNIEILPQNGTAQINRNGTPDDYADDFIEYQADNAFNGFDSFVYSIVSADGVRSTAEVTLNVGTVDPNNLLVEMSFEFVNAAGTPVSSVNVGDTVGLRINVEDLRAASASPNYVFAAYLDVLYDSGILTLNDPIDGALAQESNLDFGVYFAGETNSLADGNFDPLAASGFGDRLGIVDEFGTNDDGGSGSRDNPGELATIFFTATAPGAATVVGSPADFTPFRDTLLIGRDTPVPIEQIVFDRATLTVNPPGGEGEALHNASFPEDVNADGFASAIDALIVVNALSRAQTFRAEGEAAAASSAAKFFTDVNGDGKMSALDALGVINHLNRAAQNQHQDGEGEVALPTSVAEESAESIADAVFADLDEADPVVGGAGEASDSTVAGPVIAEVDDDSDDEEDDSMLALLADDVGNVWS